MYVSNDVACNHLRDVVLYCRLRACGVCVIHALRISDCGRWVYFMGKCNNGKYKQIYVSQAVSYEEIFPRNFGVGGVKKFPWKISSGAQSEDLGPSLTIEEFFSRKYSWFYMQRIS